MMMIRRLLYALVALTLLLGAGALALVYFGAYGIVGVRNGGEGEPTEPGSGERRIDVGPPAATLAVLVEEPKLPPRATIFVLHGIGDHKESMRHWGERLTTAGYRAVLVDSRGHGHSTGRWLTYGVQESRDLSQLIDALGIHGPIGVMGMSYGAATAIEWAGVEPRVAAAVAVAPFASLRDVVPLYVPASVPVIGRFLPRWLIMRVVDRAGRIAGFDPDAASPKAAAAQAHAPILLIHGDHDQTVPLWNSALIVAHAPTAHLTPLAGEDHERISGDPRLWPLALDFFAGVFK
jgi:pimeloyl-ACP methyl ester carboxylesterase